MVDPLQILYSLPFLPSGMGQIEGYFLEARAFTHRVSKQSFINIQLLMDIYQLGICFGLYPYMTHTLS